MLGVILRAEKAAPARGLCGYRLNGGELVGRENLRVRWQRFDLVEVRAKSVENGGAGREERVARPASVTVIARAAIGSSRPRGLRLTDPPSATVASCKPQQLPQTGTPAAKVARAKSIFRATEDVRS